MYSKSKMKSFFIITAILSTTLATPNGFYHQEYNYKTSSSSYKNHELQHRNDDEGFYAKSGDIEGRLQPRVNAHSQHSEYVNPKLQHGYRIGTDRTESFGQLHAQDRFQLNHEMGHIEPNMQLQQVTNNIEQEMQRELQRAVQNHYQSVGAITPIQVENERRILEEELRRNMTIRLQEALKMHYGNQGIRGGYSYSIIDGRLQPTANYNNQELVELTRQMEENLMRQLNQQVQSYYRVDTQTHTTRNTYRVNGASQQQFAPSQQQLALSQQHIVPPEQHIIPPQQHIVRPQQHIIAPQQHIVRPQQQFPPSQQHIVRPQQQFPPSQQQFAPYFQHPPQPQPHPVAPIPDSITTVATRVQTELNEILNKILDDTQRRYFSENSYNPGVDYNRILLQLQDELRANITFHFDDQIKRAYGYGNYGKYSIEDIENLRRQIETNLITKLNRDFNKQREKFLHSQRFYVMQHQQPITTNHIQYPIITEINYQQNIDEMQRQLQQQLSRDLQMALMKHNYRQAHIYDGQNPANYQATLEQLSAELNRNLTRQMEIMNANQYQSDVYATQLAHMRNQLQHDLMRQLQQGLQQSYRQYSSWSSRTASSSNYRPVRGYDSNAYGIHGASIGGVGEDCMMGDDPSTYQQENNDDLTQQTEDLTQQAEDLTQQSEDLTQQSQDLTQQTEDLTQQTQSHDVLTRQVRSDEDLTQQTEDLTQQTEDLTQQTEDLTQQTEDLTQQTEDLTQQTQSHEDLTQQVQSHGDLTQQIQSHDDLTPQTQSHDDLTQQTQSHNETQNNDDLTQKDLNDDDITQRVEPINPIQVINPPLHQHTYTPYQNYHLTPSSQTINDWTQQTADMTQPIPNQDYLHSVPIYERPIEVHNVNPLGKPREETIYAPPISSPSRYQSFQPQPVQVYPNKNPYIYLPQYTSIYQWQPRPMGPRVTQATQYYENLNRPLNIGPQQRQNDFRVNTKPVVLGNVRPIGQQITEDEDLTQQNEDVTESKRSGLELPRENYRRYEKPAEQLGQQTLEDDDLTPQSQNFPNQHFTQETETTEFEPLVINSHRENYRANSRNWRPLPLVKPIRQQTFGNDNNFDQQSNVLTQSQNTGFQSLETGSRRTNYRRNWKPLVNVQPVGQQTLDDDDLTKHSENNEFTPLTIGSQRENYWQNQKPVALVKPLGQQTLEDDDLSQKTEDLTQQSQDINITPLEIGSQRENYRQNWKPVTTIKPIYQQNVDDDQLTQQNQNIFNQDFNQQTEDLTQQSENTNVKPLQFDSQRENYRQNWKPVAPIRPIGQQTLEDDDLTQQTEDLAQLNQNTNIKPIENYSPRENYRQNLKPLAPIKPIDRQTVDDDQLMQQVQNISNDLTQQSDDLTQQNQNSNGKPLEIDSQRENYRQNWRLVDPTSQQNLNDDDLTQQSQTIFDPDLTQQSQTMYDPDLTQQSQTVFDPQLTQNLDSSSKNKRLTEAQLESQRLIDLLRNHKREEPTRYNPQPVYNEQQQMVGMTRYNPHLSYASQNQEDLEEVEPVKPIEPIEPQEAHEVLEVTDTYPEITTINEPKGRSILTDGKKIEDPTSKQIHDDGKKIEDPTTKQIQDEVSPYTVQPIEPEEESDTTTKKPKWWKRIGQSIRNKLG